MFPSQKSARFDLHLHRVSGFNEAGMFPSQKFQRLPKEYPPKPASMRPGCFHPRNDPCQRFPDALQLASMRPGCFHPRNVIWR